MNTGVVANTRTRYFPNRSQLHYHWTSQFFVTATVYIAPRTNMRRCSSTTVVMLMHYNS